MPPYLRSAIPAFNRQTNAAGPTSSRTTRHDVVEKSWHGMYRKGRLVSACALDATPVDAVEIGTLRLSAGMASAAATGAMTFLSS